MYEFISQFYPLPPLSPEDAPAPSTDLSNDEEKAKSNPPYDTSAGKATPYITLPYLTALYSLHVDSIAIPGGDGAPVDELTVGVQQIEVRDGK